MAEEKEDLYRGYRLEPLGTFPMVKIMSRGSGPIPVALSGLFTTRQAAMRGVDLYLDNMTKGKRKAS